MKTLDTLEAVTDLLALAKEIAQAEGLDERAALRRALAELPRLVNDVQTDVRYTMQRKPVTRWRPVQQERNR